MKQLLLLASLVLFSGCQGTGGLAPWMNMGTQMAGMAGYDAQSQMVGGIKEALLKGTDTATTQLSARGAFRLSLPERAQPVANTLRQFGMGSYVDRVENAMNRGAERAVAQARPVFKQAIRDMQVNDAMGIIQGGETAATDYFRSSTETTLRGRYQPIVENSLRETGFYEQYQSLLAVYNQLPITNKPDMDLESHVIDRSMDTLYTRIGEQEKLIRQNPMGQGSALIGQVFSAGSTR